MPRVLIIGATGRIGREVVRLLAGRDIAVRALVRTPESADLRAGVEVVRGDLRDAESLARACADVDRMMLVTPDDRQQAALEAAAIGAAARAGVRHIVKVSACMAAAPESGRFGEQHARAEAALCASGVGWTILRPHIFMQNFLEFAPMIASKRMFMAPFADAAVTMIDARDVAAVVCAVLGREEQFGQTHLLTGPWPLRFAEKAAIVGSEIGAPVVYRPVPGVVAGLAMLAGRTPWWQMRGILEVFAFVRAGREAATSDAVQRLTGRAPLGFAEFVHEHRASFSRV